MRCALRGGQHGDRRPSRVIQTAVTTTPLHQTRHRSTSYSCTTENLQSDAHTHTHTHDVSHATKTRPPPPPPPPSPSPTLTTNKQITTLRRLTAGRTTTVLADADTVVSRRCSRSLHRRKKQRRKSFRDAGSAGSRTARRPRATAVARNLAQKRARRKRVRPATSQPDFDRRRRRQGHDDDDRPRLVYRAKKSRNVSKQPSAADYVRLDQTRPSLLSRTLTAGKKNKPQFSACLSTRNGNGVFIPAAAAHVRTGAFPVSTSTLQWDSRKRIFFCRSWPACSEVGEAMPGGGLQPRPATGWQSFRDRLHEAALT